MASYSWKLPSSWRCSAFRRGWSWWTSPFRMPRQPLRGFFQCRDGTTVREFFELWRSWQCGRRSWREPGTGHTSASSVSKLALHSGRTWCRGAVQAMPAAVSPKQSVKDAVEEWSTAHMRLFRSIEPEY